MDNCGEEICGGDIPDEYKIILGFNEPNQGDQANMSPQEAALEWIEVMGR